MLYDNPVLRILINKSILHKLEVDFIYKIYKYTNLINNKIYIGQTRKSLEERAINGSNYKGSTYFYNAIKQYGWENFKGEVLEEVDSVEMANKREKFYINLYNSTNKDIGYNITSVGWNCEMAEETKNIISEKAKERYKDKTKNPMYGKKHSEESLEKMSLKKQGINNPMYGVKMSEESKEKRAKTIKENNIYLGHEWTDEERKRVSKRMQKQADKWRKKILCIEDNLIFNSITDAAKYYGVSVSTLSGHLHNHQHICAGKHFKFVD